MVCENVQIDRIGDSYVVSEDIFKETYLLNELAGYIIIDIMNGKDVESIIDQILEEYNVDKDILENDVRDVIKTFIEYGILK